MRVNKTDQEAAAVDLQKLKKAGPKNLLKLRLSFARQLEPEPVFEFLSAVESQTTQRLKRLSRESRKEAKTFRPGSIQSEILASYFEDEVALAESAVELASLFAIVALYSQIEMRTKQMCVASVPDAKPGALFRWKDLKELLLKNGIDLQKLVRYDEVNRLRCLNNAIKHGDSINAELAETGWGDRGARLDANKCRLELREFANAGEAYLKDLHKNLAVLLNQLTNVQLATLLKSKQ
jgi:hypothetical protein